MPLINHAKKEINAKILYFGPATAGKAGNLNFVYSKLKETSRGQFKAMDLQKDRMLFYDFLPTASGSVDGYSIRFHVYTISGVVKNPSSWKMVLKGVDGLVFVADSRPECSTANVESFRALNVALASYGRSTAEVPLVVQCNKQDIAGALPPEQIARVLDVEGLPLFPATATTGEGVLDTLFTLVKMVLKNVRSAGIEIAEQAEHLQPAREEPATQPRAVEAESGRQTEQFAPSVTVAGLKAPAEETGKDISTEPVIETAGAPELVEGVLRLPILLRCGSEVKKITLAISLTSSTD